MPSPPAPAWSDPGLLPVLDLVAQRMGLVFSEGRRSSIEQALRRARSAAGAPDWKTYGTLLATDSAAFDALANDLTVDESYFFRDRMQFDLVRTQCLPALAAYPGPVRVWSAGCAAGQEPYSLAILCHEAGVADRAHVVGTDLSRDRLATAARGRFSRWSLRGVSEDVVQRYFESVDVRLQLKPSIRRIVEFRQMNLADPGAWATAPKDVDILFCRNVLIYFQPDAIALAAENLIASLSERGWLLVGASDPPIADYTTCLVEVTPAGLAYRRPGARKIAAPKPRPAMNPLRIPDVPAPVRPEPAAVPAAPPAAAVVRSLADRGLLAEAAETCRAALKHEPTSVDLSCLYAMLLSQSGRYAEAVTAARRALYLDRSLALGHTTLGFALAQIGDRDGAARSLRTAQELLAGLPGDHVLPAGGGETVTRVRAAVTARLALMAPPE